LAATFSHWSCTCLGRGVPSCLELYLEEIVEAPMLVLDSGGRGVDEPVAVDDVLVVVDARAEGETGPEEYLAILTHLPDQPIEGLPLFPAAANEYFLGVFLLTGFPDEIGLFGGAGSKMDVAAL
jgi:hypothetical protein